MEARYVESEEFVKDFKWLMGSPKGRRIAYWLIASAGVYQTTFEETPVRSNYMALSMAHAEGRKDMGYRVMNAINMICPDEYFKMVKEQRNVRFTSRFDEASGNRNDGYHGAGD
jgi:hypothetical protein